MVLISLFYNFPWKIILIYENERQEACTRQTVKRRTCALALIYKSCKKSNEVELRNQEPENAKLTTRSAKL